MGQRAFLVVRVDRIAIVARAAISASTTLWGMLAVWHVLQIQPVGAAIDVPELPRIPTYSISRNNVSEETIFVMISEMSFVPWSKAGRTPLFYASNLRMRSGPFQGLKMDFLTEDSNNLFNLSFGVPIISVRRRLQTSLVYVLSHAHRDMPCPCFAHPIETAENKVAACI